MQIQVYNQDNFRISSGFNDTNIEDFKNNYFICINSSGSRYGIPVFKKKHNRVLNMFFDDTERNKIKVSSPIVYYAVACKASQAKSIKEFVDTIPESATIHVYCAKGKSRSTAVAKFIEEYRKVYDKTKFDSYNTFVYNLLWSQV
jgi:predicted protein tyrosine phosphatase